MYGGDSFIHRQLQANVPQVEVGDLCVESLVELGLTRGAGVQVAPEGVDLCFEILSVEVALTDSVVYCRGASRESEDEFAQLVKAPFSGRALYSW